MLIDDCPIDVEVGKDLEIVHDFVDDSLVLVDRQRIDFQQEKSSLVFQLKHIILL